MRSPKLIRKKRIVYRNKENQFGAQTEYLCFYCGLPPIIYENIGHETFCKYYQEEKDRWFEYFAGENKKLPLPDIKEAQDYFNKIQDIRSSHWWLIEANQFNEFGLFLLNLYEKVKLNLFYFWEGLKGF